MPASAIVARTDRQIGRSQEWYLLPQAVKRGPMLLIVEAVFQIGGTCHEHTLHQAAKRGL